jgi:hypothetical protein
LYPVVTSEGRWRVRVAAGLLLAAALLAAPTSPEPGPPGDPVADPRPTEAFAGSDVARLQRTATDVQRELADLASQIHDAERDLMTANDAAAAGRRKADLDRRDTDASNRAAAVSSELQGVVTDTNAAVVAQQQEQRQRNQTTAANWRAYLDRLTAAGITPPSATLLRDPHHFPAGLAALAEPGVAERTFPSGERILVLPAETIAAVTYAVDALDKPYVPGQDGTGPTAYSCDGLVHAAYGTLVPPGVTNQYAVMAADARLASVAVTDLPTATDAVGFARPVLARVPPRATPTATDGGLPWHCGGVSVPAGAWSGYPNGFIPQTAVPNRHQHPHRLRCDAAAAFATLNETYTRTFGQPICITDSYRTFNTQVHLYSEKPSLAAIPGTSNHGWGLALDLCGGAETFNSPQHTWLTTTAPTQGWTNPPWAHQGAGREEPWHWEYKN